MLHYEVEGAHAHLGKSKPNSFPMPLRRFRSEQTPLYVVTVNHQSEQYVQQLLRSLAFVKIVKGLVVVDHSGSLKKESLRADFPIKVVAQDNKGYAAGLNRGVAQIPETNAVVLLCNPDINILTPDTVQEVVVYLNEHRHVGCVVPTIVNKKLERTTSCRKFYTLKTLAASRLPWLKKNPPAFLRDHLGLDGHRLKPYPVDWGCGAAMFFRAELLRKKMGFDERFFLYFEDVDICTQLWRRGYSVMCHPDILFHHHERRQSQRQFYYFLVHVSSLVKYVIKYRGLPAREDLLPGAQDDHVAHFLPQIATE
jgi:GT2 family glycosyltransferase